MILKRFYDEGLAQASYLVGCSATGEALIVDPNRRIEQYADAARTESLRITHVTETHIHADFLSGLRELTAATGAKAYVSGEGGTGWRYAFAAADGAVELHDGDAFMVGNVRIEVVHTPGHTPEHLTFVVTDTAGADRPMGAFTGDFIFAGDVGRPDLLERAAGVTGTMDGAARELYASLQKFAKRDDYLQLWPGHGAGSACGKALGAVPQTTLGYEKLFNWAFSQPDEDAFVRAVLEGQPEPPRYFAMMKRMNREGPAPRRATPPTLPDAGLLEALDAGDLVVDVRPWAMYAREHIPGTISIPYNKSFTTWAGSLLPYDRNIRLLAQDEVAARRAVEELAMIGVDRVDGIHLDNAIDRARTAGRVAESVELDVSSLEASLRSTDTFVLDVRNDSEWQEGHIPTGAGATVLHVPLASLEARIGEIPAGRDVLVHCKAGGRSAIATSILASHGVRAVNVKGGFDAWKAARLPVEQTHSAEKADAGRAN
jgi:hydroxyacylglutathione hydrolase